MYTQGEWTADKSMTGDWVIATRTEVIAREVRHYNAQLIAAAPLLYEALKEATEYLSMTPSMSIDSGSEMHLNWQRLLAKTEGK